MSGLTRPIQVMKGEASTLVLSPRELPAPFSTMSSCTAQIRTPATDGFQAITATPNTTDSKLKTAAAEGDRSIVADGTAPANNFEAGMRLLLATYDAEFAASYDSRPTLLEVVDLDNDGTDDTIYLAEPLPRAYAAASLLGGWQVSLDLTTVLTAELGAFDVRLEADLADGQKIKWWERGYVVNWPVHPPLNISNIGQHLPEVWRRRATEDDTLAEAIGAAWVDILLPALEAQGIDFWTIRETSRLAPAHAAAVALHQIVSDERVPTEFVDQTRRLYRERLELALGAKRFWADTDEDTAVDDPNPATWTEFTR